MTMNSTKAAFIKWLSIIWLLSASIQVAAASLSIEKANQQLAVAAFAPTTIKYPEISEGDLAIQVMRGKDWPLHVSVARHGAAPRVLALPEIAEQVEEIHVHGDRLVIGSWMGPDNQMNVVVFDLAGGVQVDQFWCYEPAVSPDGASMVFVKFFPAHFISEWEDQVFLYDLNASPNQNRPAFGTFVPATDRSSREMEVGLPLFPLAPDEIGRGNVGEDKDGPRFHHKVSSFTWSADSRRVAWIDQRDSATSLVVADTLSAIRQDHNARLDPALVDTRSVPLPEIADMCGENFPPKCVDFSYGLTRLSLADETATLDLSTSGHPPQTRHLHVDLHQLAPVPR